MNISILQALPTQKKLKPADANNLPFGDLFSDHMFIVDYEYPIGWINHRIVPYSPLFIDPAAMGIHYGQELFEGLKAYRRKDNKINLFRARDNFIRLNRSADRLCMPTVDIGDIMEGLKKLLMIDRDWIPAFPGTSLYIRPTMLATEPHLGVRPSKRYVFYIIICPVGAYYKEGLNPVKIYVEDVYTRTSKGGTGDAKVGGNYAASLLAAEKAKDKGFTQVLWLDSCERKYIEEVGTMNIFFLVGDEIVTPPLDGNILPGITRDSAINIAKKWGLNVREHKLTIDEVVAFAKNGTLKEVFGTGTAAVISPVGMIHYKGEDIVIAGGKMGDLSQRLYDEIVGVQYGDRPDVYGWVECID